MTINLVQGVGAYQRTLGRTPDASAASDTASGPTFGRLVTDMVTEASRTAKAAETASIRAVAGKASLVDVVTSVQAAETQLETIVAIRDRVVSAYQDIMRMAI